MSLKICKFALLITTILLIHVAQAQESQDQSSRVSQACADKEQGDVCDFVDSAGNSVNGNCQVTANGKLNCAPLN